MTDKHEPDISNFPEGIVTLLFTDIQGSTPLWEQDPQGMREALALHDQALHQAIAAHDGRVIKTVGDEFQAVFIEPLQALAAAIAAQRRLTQTQWGRIGPLTVRMGLHTGQAQWAGSDYAGSHTFNRVARIMSAGHGGQILLSRETETLLRKRLLADVQLLDMGRHSLKGLSHQEHLFQVVAPDLPHTFPPLKTVDAVRHNLPAQVTAFIGREQEIEEIATLLTPHSAEDRQVRLLTLTGPGGTGKTRLALEVAGEIWLHFAHGVAFVDLAAVRDPAFVLPAVERSLGLRASRGLSMLESITVYLQDKEILLLLDNFEQLLPAAQDVAALLTAVPGLKILVTSRSLLRVYGEVGYELRPMQLPDPRRLPRLEALLAYESIRLFDEHARAVKTDFKIDTRNAAAVAEICSRLDGLPLAIELAAARVRMLTAQQMLKQLENRFRILSGGARDLPPRQRTLRGAIDWSYNLLTLEEQALFRRLGVFAGSCSFEAAEAVCNAAADVDVFGGLEVLIDHSLIRPSGAAAEPRFVMLQTIADYARQKLQNNGEESALRRAHLSFFTQLAEQARSYLETAEQDLWFDHLERDHDNFSAALQFAIAENDGLRGVRLAQALRIFWFSRGHLVEGRQFLRRLLSLELPPADRAAVLDSAGFLARYHGDYAAAERYIMEGLALARELGDQHATADSLANIGFVYLQQERLAQARATYKEALAIYGELRNEQGTADASIHLGLIAFYERDTSLAQQYYQRSLAIWQRLGDKQGIVYTQHMLGDAAFLEGRYETAAGLYLESLQEALVLSFQLVIAAAMEGLALIAAVREQSQRALQLAGAAHELRRRANIPASPAREVFIEQGLAAAWENLGEEVGENSWRGGREMSFEAAADYAVM
ncbi:MAG: tetratricopeptide repeat protein [Candidatus Promineifilaceae bacterium]|nr:tetratricopeptide repeat protein [Candidatus Promineifilaceae bacterium]